jgi:hypothetical protein
VLQGQSVSLSPVFCFIAAAAAAAAAAVLFHPAVAHPAVAHGPQVVLTATSSLKLNKAVTLKAPLYGAVGGADMVQTIFSDYAPNEFPRDAVSMLSSINPVSVTPLGACLAHFIQPACSSYHERVSPLLQLGDVAAW